MKHITVILSLLLAGLLPAVARERKLSCEITPMTPCYNGNISSRVFAGGRYDYTYDGYDSNSNISSLSRSGVINIVGGVPVYNTHDYLYYTYDGNQLVSLGAGSAGVNYEGRTGLGSINDGDLTYDANGNLTSDGTRGIASVSYTLLNQPERIDFDSKEALVNSYDGRGFKHMSRLLDGSGKIVTLRRYIGDAIIEDGAVTMQRFAGGYFDANGVANYYMTDYQGNVTEVVNASGAVVQSVRYYPDGEPWMEPTGTNRYTFGGKERVNLGGLNQYDFGPRLLNAAAGVWGAPDPMAEKYYGISPYSYCAGNPVIFVDPDGKRPSNYAAALMSAIVYEDDDSKEFEKYLQALHDLDWHISIFMTSIQMNHPAGTKMGIQSMLFEREVDGVKEYAYVYAGTQSWEDGVEDILQLVGLAPQYSKAIENARTLSLELSDNELTFVGHSLGGGEAAAASMATGRAAITFNPAAISPYTMLRYGLSDASNVTNFRAFSRIGGGCIISQVQDRIGMITPGTVIPVFINRDPFTSHMIKYMVQYFKDHQ